MKVKLTVMRAGKTITGEVTLGAARRAYRLHLPQDHQANGSAASFRERWLPLRVASCIYGAASEPDVTEPANILRRRTCANANFREQQRAASSNGRSQHPKKLRPVSSLSQRRSDRDDKIESLTSKHAVQHISANNGRGMRMALAPLTQLEDPAYVWIAIDAHDRHTEHVSQPVVPGPDANADVAHVERSARGKTRLDPCPHLEVEPGGLERGVPRLGAAPDVVRE